MRYSIKSAESPTQRKMQLTWQDAFEALEFNQILDRTSAKELAEGLEAHEVFNNLTVAQLMKASGTLEKLGDEALKDMSETFGHSIESLKKMSVEAFIELTNKYMPTDAKPATEVTGLTILLVSAFAYYLVMITGAILMARKITKYEFWWDKKSASDAEIQKVIREKGLKAITEIMVDCFDKKEFDRQIKACNAITKLLSFDMKKIYDPKFKIVDIEKFAVALWSAPKSIVMTSSSVDTYLGINDWFQGWTDNCPKPEMKTLGEHGFTFSTLKSTCDALIAMGQEVVKLSNVHANVKEGHVEAKKAISPGFWGEIKLLFTEKKEDREARKQAELILNAKYVAMKNLIYGYNWSVRTMCGQFFTIAMKTDKYVTK